MNKFKGVLELVKHYQENSAFPGASFLITSHEKTIFIGNVGRLTPEPDAPFVTEHTIYDLASLTKPIATTTAILQLFEKNLLFLDDSIGKHLPDFSTSQWKPITIFHLLTHTSGIPSWIPLYVEQQGFDAMIHAIAQSIFPVRPGSMVIYSCLNYFILTAIIRKITGLSLSKYAQTSIFGPLGMKDTFFNPPGELLYRIAPTEMGNQFERCLIGPEASSFLLWRNYRIHGEVHDCNCYYSGGESGNSGLFSTVNDLAIFMRCLLNGGRGNQAIILSSETIRLASTNHTKNLNVSRGLGWLLADSTTGKEMPSIAFGHNGFTGTSLWIDPSNNLGIVFLSNRVYFPRPPKEKDTFHIFRSEFHDRVYKCFH